MMVDWGSWLEEVVDKEIDITTKEFFWKGIKEYSRSVMARDSEHKHWYANIIGCWVPIPEEKYTTCLKTICFNEADFMELPLKLQDDWQARQVW